MKLVTKDIEKKFKKQGRNEDIHTAKVIAKFFTPDSNWTWYASEYEPETGMFFGFVQGFEGELGYFSLHELETARGPLGLKIERDLYWDDTKTLATVMGVPAPEKKEEAPKTETITDRHGNEVRSLF